MQAGVNGFNKLTENDLALNANQNRKGKITGIKLSSQNFRIQRKFNTD
jgi:hypothetical protein